MVLWRFIEPEFVLTSLTLKTSGVHADHKIAHCSVATGVVCACGGENQEC